jgi:hypothetical protein
MKSRILGDRHLEASLVVNSRRSALQEGTTSKGEVETYPGLRLKFVGQEERRFECLIY